MMLLSGIDLVEINRIESSLSDRGFMQRVFGNNELLELSKKRGARLSESAAGAFAAKEAFLKAFGVGLGAVPLCEIEILHKDSGAPYFKLSGKAAELAHGAELCLSISHTSTVATAIVTGGTI